MLYEISDFFYTSQYEGKRDNYKKLVKKLEGYKKDLDKAIKECDQSISNFYKTYEEDSKLYGDAVDLFFEKSKELKDKTDRYKERLQHVNGEISSKITDARELYNQYVQKCEEEDKELKKKWEEEHK